MSKLQILKLRIIFAKPPKSGIDWDGKPITREGKLVPYKPLEAYLKIGSKSNIYLKLEDRLFYSPTLSNFYKIMPREVKDSLVRYILEGISVSETSIEGININTEKGSYIIRDIYEVVGSEEIFENIKDL